MIKRRIASLAFDVLQRSLEAFIANEIDIQLWTQCFYRLYAEKRANLQAVGKEEISAFIAMTNEGAEYYEYLIRVVSTISDGRRAECIYPFYIHLGDIYRYKAGVTEKDDKSVWKKCESCYREAIQINPNNGNAFHQLAIVATSLLLARISPSQHRATCLALYYCIRAISCDHPFVTAFTNIAFHFERNKEELEKVKGLSFSLPRKQALDFLSCHFIQLHALLSSNAPSAEFKSLSSRFQDSLQWCLEHDYAPAPLLFRMFVIHLFAAADSWRYLRDPSGCSFSASQ